MSGIPRWVLTAFAVVAAGGLAGWKMTAQDAEAQPRTVWQMARAYDIGFSSDGFYRYSVARICFATRKGCRYETVRVTVPAIGDFRYEALHAAAARLGEEGWEPFMTETPNYDQNVIGSLLFRRQQEAAIE